MIRGVKMDLGGKTYIVPPLSLGAIEAMQERISNFAGGTRLESVGTVIDALHSALLRNYPDISRDQVANMVDLGCMQEVMEAVMDVSGLKRKAQEQGEALPGSL
jgi:dihydroxyacetone kinase DhaKLM complex PTS-EIIA-like component DhaM